MTFKKSPCQCEKILCSLEGTPFWPSKQFEGAVCFVLGHALPVRCVFTLYRVLQYFLSMVAWCTTSEPEKEVEMWTPVSARSHWRKLTTHHPVELESGVIFLHERPQGPSLRLIFGLKFKIYIARDKFLRLFVNCNTLLQFEKRISVDSEIRSFGARCKRRGFSSGAATRQMNSTRGQTDFFFSDSFFCFWDVRFSCPVSKKVVSGFETKKLMSSFQKKTEGGVVENQLLSDTRLLDEVAGDNVPFRAVNGCARTLQYWHFLRQFVPVGAREREGEETRVKTALLDGPHAGCQIVRLHRVPSLHWRVPAGWTHSQTFEADRLADGSSLLFCTISAYVRQHMCAKTVSRRGFSPSRETGFRVVSICQST